jgi:hypothetical protein
MRFILAGLMVLSLFGCSAAQKATAISVAQDGAIAVQVADDALKAADAIVNAVSPGSQTAQTLNTVLIKANKVDDVVTSITVPVVTSITTALPTTTPAATPAQ